MSALDDLRIIQHYIQHAYVTDGGISAECRGELATAIESLGETLVGLENRLYAAERAIDTLQSLTRKKIRRLPTFDSPSNISKPTTDGKK